MGRQGTQLSILLLFCTILQQSSAIPTRSSNTDVPSAGNAADSPVSDGASSNRIRRGRDSYSVVRPFPYLFPYRFANDECVTDDGHAGTCYTSQECSDVEGTNAGECAEGQGICCSTIYTCRQTVNHNVSYFVPPHHPHKEKNANVCPLRIQVEPEVCQIRLDFVRFDILGPRDGDCLDDMFVVLGSNRNHKIPVLCGENTGHHIYINVDTIDAPIVLQMNTGIAPYARDWRIKISMIPCESQYRAPVGCLQFVTGIKGHVRSFNFNQRNESRFGYLNDLDYAICIRRERDMCSVTYSVRSEKDDAELLTDANDSTPYGAPEAIARAIREPQANSKIPAFGIATSDGKSMDFQAAAKAGVTKCTGDYLAIPGLDRFCGGAFSLTSDSRESQSVTVKDSGPLMVMFKSDKAFNGRGFNINFYQGPCTPQAYF
ncbi:uncharacterized protein LOC100905950 [Galendromus occidentalis]|uniref:Uncharacterized protein LOC100905950 n=1 Tax=Galendromus occidentalis TaxID=34638 RepID=A0AAJ6VUR3_9ACAR|nr:uncharacterized protein LOC100905950 [Galendromus occidentalis]